MVSKQIYLIEDDPKNLKLFRAILNKFENIELHFAMEGDKGLSLIKSTNPKVIDLIILDIRLPKMSGIEICKELRTIEGFKNIPIIAVTAYAMDGDKERIMNAGFTEYMSKPIKIKEFKKLIQSYL